MSDLITIAREWASRATRGRAALVTVVSAHGSTFRKSGARMLVFEDGTVSGSVSGGCFEAALVDAALETIATGESTVLRYDGEKDDTLFGEGAMCDGSVAIGVEAVDDALSELLERIVAGELPMTVCVLQTAASRVRTCAGSEAGHESLWTSELVRQPFQVVVCGAGALASSIGRLARAIGWDSKVVDHRPAALESLDPSIRRGDGPLEDLIDDPANCAVVVATHHLDRDAARVEEALRLAVPYVGLVGSKGRGEMLMTRLDRSLHDRLDLLRTPAGLDIGSESVEEIALSIVAEIQAARTVSSGAPLSRGARRVHHRGSARVAAVILAAGASTRMGPQKVVAELSGGLTMIEEVIAAVSSCGVTEILVVEGIDERVGNVARSRGVRTVRNRDASRGLSSSILVAMQALADDVEAVLFVLADQPRISARSLARIVETWRGGEAPVVATRYAEGGGVPAIFAREIMPELARLEGDRGARDLIRTLEGVALVDGIDTRDVDEPRDLASLRGEAR